MESRENLTRPWPIAVILSLVLHGAILAAFALLGGGPGLDARVTPQFISMALVEESNANDTNQDASSAAERSPHAIENTLKPADFAEPLVATLRDTWISTPDEGNRSPNVGNAVTATSVTGQAVGALLPVGATTSFFQIPVYGRNIVYVVDASASMGKNGALALACRELEESLQKLPPNARFQVIVYTTVARTLLPRRPDWLEPTDNMFAEVANALRALARQTPEGGTDHTPALRKAFLLGPDVVFFLTDADDLMPEHVSLVRELNKGRAVINTVELTTRHRGRLDMPLQVLAREHRGVYRAVDLQPR